jgi:DNA-binding MarR family transcriptional regulator
MWRTHTGNNRKAFRALARLREQRAFEKAALEGMDTPEDRDLIYEIGHRQGALRPLTMKEALLMELGSLATVQRRLRRLRRLGLVLQARSEQDRRVQELSLSPRALGAFARYDDLLRNERWEEAA